MIVSYLYSSNKFIKMSALTSLTSNNKKPHSWFEVIVSSTLPFILLGIIYLVVQYNDTQHLRREFDVHITRAETKIAEFDQSKVETAVTKKEVQDLKIILDEVRLDVKRIMLALNLQPTSPPRPKNDHLDPK